MDREYNKIGSFKAEIDGNYSIYIENPGVILLLESGFILENVFIEGIIISFIQLIIWLYLVRRYFETDWGKALVISIISVLVSFTITFVLAILGIGIISGIN